MNMIKNTTQQLQTNLLICGSSNVTNPDFLNNILESEYLSLKLIEQKYGVLIGSVFVGKKTGTDAIVRKWALSKGIKIEDFTPPNSKAAASVFDSDCVPQMVISRDKNFYDGAKVLKKLGINKGIIIPNSVGKLGAVPRNMTRMLKLAEIPYIDGSEHYKNYVKVQALSVMSELKQKSRHSIK